MSAFVVVCFRPNAERHTADLSGSATLQRGIGEARGVGGEVRGLGPGDPELAFGPGAQALDQLAPVDVLWLDRPVLVTVRIDERRDGNVGPGTSRSGGVRRCDEGRTQQPS